MSSAVPSASHQSGADWMTRNADVAYLLNRACRCQDTTSTTLAAYFGASSNCAECRLRVTSGI